MNTDIPMNKVLVMMVGFPRSGKSTAARQLATIHNAPIVCPDEIRYALHGEDYIADREPEVWQIAHVMVKALFNAGHQNVILDACNNTVASLALKWLAISICTLSSARLSPRTKRQVLRP